MLTAQALPQNKCVLCPDGNDQAQTQGQALQKNRAHQWHGFTR
jgi:histone acetyltransferase (RNA polymerase elongator complex component)